MNSKIILFFLSIMFIHNVYSNCMYDTFMQALINKYNCRSISDYQNWITNLSSSGYNVAQGNVFVLDDATCPTLVSVFGSCFGNNPASPYIVPQPPVGNAYDDPYYGIPLDTPGPDGKTNIIYRLGNNDALVTVVLYPPQAAYCGYQSYVATSEISNYVNVKPLPRTISPDPNRYGLAASIGNDINNIIIQNQYGVAPWGNVIMYITTSNKVLADSLITNAQLCGISKNSIFIESIGSNVITGNGSNADDFITLMRYAVPKSSSDSNNWMNSLNENVLVYKVSKSDLKVARYGENKYTPHIVNNAETTFVPSLRKALRQLADLLKTYLSSKQSTPSEAKKTIPLTIDNAQGVPVAGLVGSFCIKYGTACQADNQDTSTYASRELKTLGLQETAFIIGVNHNVLSLNNTRYVSVDIYNIADLAGIASASQTNPSAVGFDSGVMTGSVQAILRALNIKVPANYKELKANLSNLYVTFITRNINNPTVSAIAKYGINLKGTSLVPANTPIGIIERSYVVPGTTAGGNVNYMLYPIIVAASDDF